jgi:hypothetical protein
MDILQERCDKLQSDIRWYFSRIFRSEVTVEIEHDGESPYVIVDGWLNLCPTTFNKRGIGGSIRTAPSWRAERTIYVPGVRTFSNGDPGYPNDSDFEDLEQNIEPAQIIFYAARQILENWIDGLGETKDHEDMMKEEEPANK